MSTAIREVNDKVLAALACSNPAPGSEEFERMAADTTHISRVRKGFSHQSNTLTADIGDGSHTRRNESINKSRG